MSLPIVQQVPTPVKKPIKSIPVSHSQRAKSVLAEPSCDTEVFGFRSNPTVYVILISEAISMGSLRAASMTDVHRFLTSPLVTIEVGKLQQKYYVHKALLVANSPWFAACLKPNFVEGQELKITMKEDTPGVVGALLHWLYDGDLRAAFFASPSLQYRSWMCMHVDMYILADKLLMPKLKDLVVDRVRSSLLSNQVSKAISQLHKSGLLSTKLGTMLVRHLACQLAKDQSKSCSGLSLGDNSDEKELDKLCDNSEIAKTLLKAIVGYHFGEWNDPRTEPASTYHEGKEA